MTDWGEPSGKFSLGATTRVSFLFIRSTRLSRVFLPLSFVAMRLGVTPFSCTYLHSIEPYFFWLLSGKRRFALSCCRSAVVPFVSHDGDGPAPSRTPYAPHVPRRYAKC